MRWLCWVSQVLGGSAWHGAYTSSLRCMDRVRLSGPLPPSISGRGLAWADCAAEDLSGIVVLLVY